MDAEIPKSVETVLGPVAVDRGAPTASSCTLPLSVGGKKNRRLGSTPCQGPNRRSKPSQRQQPQEVSVVRVEKTTEGEP